MKRTLFFSLYIVFFGLILTGCHGRLVDHAGFSYYVWVNGSSHTLSLSVDGHVYSEPYGNTPSGFENEILEPGERFERYRSGMASSPPPRSSWRFRVVFDDGTYGAIYGGEWVQSGNEWEYVPYVPSEHYDERYDPTIEDNYVETQVKNPFGCKECSGRRWTYTFTNDDYAAAVARGPFVEE